MESQPLYANSVRKLAKNRAPGRTDDNKLSCQNDIGQDKVAAGTNDVKLSAEAAADILRVYITRWAFEHYTRTLTWPRLSSGKINQADSGVLTWLEAVMRIAPASQYPSVSFAEVIEQVKIEEDLQQTGLRKRLKDFHNRHERIPRINGRDDILGLPSWLTLHTRLRKSACPFKTLRDLAEDEGLRTFERGFTKDDIYAAIRAHIKRTGKKPRSASTLIFDDPQKRTWSAIGQALQRGVAGIKKGTSLARLATYLEGARGWPDKKKAEN